MTHTLPTLAVLVLGLSFGSTGQEKVPAEQVPTDPEASVEGRESYLGREIARTMHWTGAEWLLRESREDEEHCSKLLQSLGDLKGKTICDFGCGNGFYSLPLAERVGPQGRVLAVDLQPEMLELLKARAAQTTWENISTVQASLTDTGLAPQSCDGILLVDVYHEISHPVTVLKGLREALKQGGKLYLAEYRLEDPKVPIKLKHKMSKAQMILEMQANGLRFAEEDDALPWQHVMAFERDPDFDGQQNQEVACARAVARGLRRALLAGDHRALTGFVGEEVRLLAGSVLLKAGEDMQQTRLSRTQWHERFVAVAGQFDPEQWKAKVASWKLEVRGQGEPRAGAERMVLVAEGPDARGQWVFSKTDRGQWLVSAQELGL